MSDLEATHHEQQERDSIGRSPSPEASAAQVNNMVNSAATQRDSLSSNGTTSSSLSRDVDLDSATIMTAAPAREPSMSGTAAAHTVGLVSPADSSDGPLAPAISDPELHEERPVSLQSVSLTEPSNEDDSSRRSSARQQQKKPAALKLAGAQSTPEPDEGPLQPVDLDFDDLESVAPSTAAITPQSSNAHTPSKSVSTTATAMSGTSPGQAALNHSPRSRSESHGSKPIPRPSTPNGKVSSLRNRFEQTSPGQPPGLPYGYPPSPASPPPAQGSSSASPKPTSPLSPNNNSSGARRRSIQMIQANFQRKKLELQQQQQDHTSPSLSSSGFESKQKHKDLGDSLIPEEEAEPSAAPVAREEPGDDIDWDFWGAVVADYSSVARDQPKQLSQAIQEGIPPALRGLLWQLMSSSKDLAMEELYQSLLKLPSPHEKAILRDITRTFPHHKYFQDGESSGSGAGQENLFNVVKCYSLFDDEVGYCQGLQFLVGPLLLNMPDEEAFCVLVRLMQSHGLRTHYTPHMPGLQMRLFQFDKLLEELLPVTFLHLTRQGVKSSMYASQWWLTLFGYRFPLELVHTIMDLILAEGVEAVFRFSIALMQHNEEEILKLEFEDIVEFLKNQVYEHWKMSWMKRSTSAVRFRLSDVLSGSTKKPGASVVSDEEQQQEPQYDAKKFVKDALSVRIAPTLLDQFASEWTAMRKEQDAHHIEVEGLRRVNAQLSLQVRQLEGSLAQINEEHCELVKQVVEARLAKEAIEEELVRYKLQCAELAHRRDSASALFQSQAAPSSSSSSTVASSSKTTPAASPAPSTSMAAAATSFFGGMRPSWGRRETPPVPQTSSAKTAPSSQRSSESDVSAGGLGT